MSEYLLIFLGDCILGENMTGREKRIFDAAVEVFSKKGYDAATTKDIAEAAGVAEGTIFRYYKTKKGILHSILIKFSDFLFIDMALKPIEEIFANSKEKELKQVLHDIIMDRIAMVDKVYPVVSVLLSEILFKEDVRDALLQKLVPRITHSFEDFYNVLIKRGLVRSDLPASRVFRSVFANILVFVAQNKLSRVKYTREEFESDFESLFDIILNGIAVKE